MGPEVWFAIPSASPERCRRVLPRWREMGYKVAVLQNFERGEIPADIAVWSDTYPGWPGSINQLCASVVPPTAQIVVSGGDDMLPDPDHSAGELAEQFLARFPDGFGVMQPHGDDFLGARTFCGSPWLGRGWIERAYGGQGPMPAQYRHNWADNELYWVARCLGSLWERPDLSQRHEHFSRTGDAAPEYWTRNVAGKDRDDVQTFIARAWQHFPGCEPSDASRRFNADLFRAEYRNTAEAYWISRYGQQLVTSDAEARVRAAMMECRAQGRTIVGIFGAGTHTRALAALLMDPPVCVTCIIDENPALAGRSLWNYPIVTPAHAATLGLDAVILSSHTMEDALEAASQPLVAHGVPVIRLYGRRASA
jgi:hypothetical protein